MPRKVLITGATGLVGGYFLARILSKTDFNVIAIVRSRKKRKAEERIKNILKYFNLSYQPERLNVVEGDIISEKCGLTDASLNTCFSGLTDVFHAAADLSFDESRTNTLVDTNINGTQNLLQILPPDIRFFYVSTAYVAGKTQGEFSERDIDCGQMFNNEYERSKYIAEKMVRDYFRHKKDSLTILRPSIITGEYHNGKTFQFSGFYSVLRFLYFISKSDLPKNIYLPFISDCTKNFIPIDCLSDMIEEIFTSSNLWGKTYNLVNESPVSQLELKKLFYDVLGLSICNDDPSLALKPHNAALIKSIDWYISYLQNEPAFLCDNRNKLSSSSALMRFDKKYFEKILDFSVKARWGRSDYAIS